MAAPGYRDVFHEGEIAVQTRAGVRESARRVGGSIHPGLPDAARSFLGARDWLVATTVGDGDQPRVSALWGAPGFATAPDPRTVVLEPAPLSLAAAVPKSSGSAVGLLAMELETRDRMRANGRIVTREHARWTVEVDEGFGNCKKYIQTRESVDGHAPPDDPVEPARSTQLDGRSLAMVREADTFFIGSLHADRGADASHRGGNPGFIEIIDATRIAWPDYPGNRMFQTLGNLHANPASALLFIDFERGDLIELIGRARVDWDPARAAAMPGAERVIEFDIEAVETWAAALPHRRRLVERSPHNP